MGRERLILSVAAQSDSQGRATFQLQPAELGFVYEGSVQIPNAPSGALFSGTILNANWGQWAGPTNFGPVQCFGGEFFKATAVGLTPNTNFVMTFTGIWMSEEEAKPIPPAAPISIVSVETATVLLSARAFTAAGQESTIRPPSLTRRLTLIKHAAFVASARISVFGNQTGALYGDIGLDDNDSIKYLAIEPAVDQTYTVQFQGTGSVTISILASTTNPLIEANDAIPVTNDFSTILPLEVAAPWEPFDRQAAVTPVGATANQQVIAAPGSGQSIYVQSIIVGNLGAAVASYSRFHAAGTARFADMYIGVSDTKQAIFPGGFRLPANTALQVDVIGATTVEVTVTYAIAATI